MSQPPSPEAYEEVLKDKPFGETVRGLFEDARHFNTTQLTGLMRDSLINEITAAAEQGEFYTQYRDGDTNELQTHVHSVEDIFSGQLAAALEAQDIDPKNPDLWKVHIPRSHGLRDAVMTIMQNRRLSEPFRYAVYHKQAEIMRNKDLQSTGIEREPNEELLEKAAEDLGEEAVEASGVELEVDTVEPEVAAASRIVSLEPAATTEPIEVVAVAEKQPDPYDYLRTELPPLKKPAGPSWKSGGRHTATSPEQERRDYYERFVTEENRQEARTRLSIIAGTTPEISEILSKHRLSSVSIEAVDAIREDPDVRFEVAKVLVQKLDKMLEDGTNDIGLRVNRNDPDNEKASPMRGAEKKLSSRLYVVCMALKMIGGEFAQRLEGRDDILRDEITNRVSIGQHRHAARKLIMTQIK